MQREQFLDEIVSVTAAIDQHGNTRPTSLTWQGKEYTLISVGRQWNTENGRHVLVEASDGARYELQLSRTDLLWHIKRAWPLEMAA